MSDNWLRQSVPIISADQLARAVLERQSTGVVVIDDQWVVMVWNDWMVRWSGVAAAKAVGWDLRELFPGFADETLALAVTDVQNSGVNRIYTEPSVLASITAVMGCTEGDVALGSVRLSRLPWPAGVSSLLEFAEGYAAPPARPNADVDTSQHPDIVEASRFPGYIESAEKGVVIVDREGLICDLNRRITDLTAYAREQLLQQPVWMLFPDWNTSRGVEDFELLQTMLRQQRPEVLRMLTADGLSLQTSVAVYRAVTGADRIVLVCHDVSRQQAAKSALVRQRELLSAIYTQVADGIIMVDAEGVIEQVNPMGMSLLGLRSGQGAGLPVDEVLHLTRASSGQALFPCREALARGVVIFTPENCLLELDGREPVTVAATATPVHDRGGDIAGCVLVFRHVGAAAPANVVRSRWQAATDALTQMPNRRYLEGELQRAIRTAKVGARAHILLYIDLYNFSLVNATSGQAAGDALLRQCGRLVRQRVGIDHVVARVGNDEFAVLLKDCSAAEGRDVADAILEDIKALSFPWGERRLKIGANIGAEVIDRHTSSEIDALVAAASSCAAAKELGRNRVHFQRHREDVSQRKRVAEWIPRIGDALEEGRFCLHYQPIAPLNGNRLGGKHFEALVRMIDKRGRLIGPGKFIPAAEQYGLVDDIDRWVIDRVIRTLCALTRRQRKGLRISVNLSGLTIGDEGFREYVLNRLDEVPLDPRHLQFEITETAAIRHFDRAMELILMLKEKGCYFSLDDFGSGLSSFEYLKQLPVDCLKIDGAFVRNMELSAVDFSMVSTINHLAHVMDITTVAESIENQAQLAMLEDLGVDYGQGFFLTRPKPLEAFI